MCVLEQEDPELGELIANFIKTKVPLGYRIENEVITYRGNIVTPAVSVDIGRNDPCFCGSGKKYKKCCL